MKIEGNIDNIKNHIIEEMESSFNENFDQVLVDENLIRYIMTYSKLLNKELLLILDKKAKVNKAIVGQYNNVQFQKGESKDDLYILVHSHLGGQSKLSKEDLSTLNDPNNLAIIAVSENINGYVLSIAYKLNGSLIEKDYNSTEISRSENQISELVQNAKERIKKIQAKNDGEKAIIVGTEKSSLDELSRLAQTAGAIVVGEVIYNEDRISSRYLVRSGKLDEIFREAQIKQANLVIFDNELTATQIRNIQSSISIKIIDRTVLILDIFAKRARTKEGKLQVYLAQLKYQSTHLVGAGLYLSRLGGGIGTRGPGETKLETDRRHIRRRMIKVEKELKELEKRRNIQRQARKKSGQLQVSLMGYTNAGKSSILNALTDSDIYVKDQLFATLDPTVRKLSLPSGQTALISDTVGFVRKLPHELIKSFHSTLEEAIYADLILIVLDATSIEMITHVEIVFDILDMLDVNDKEIILVLNKIDIAKENFDKRIYAYRNRVLGIVKVSAKENINLDELKKEIESVLFKQETIIEKKIPYKNAKELSQLHENAVIIEEEYLDDYIYVKAKIKHKR